MTIVSAAPHTEPPQEGLAAEVAADALLRPVRPGNAFEDTVGRLLQTIRLGVLRPGESLPPERELAARLGVSRDTVREAIKSLSDAGYRRIAFAGWVDVYDGVPSKLSERRCRAYMQWAKDAGVFDERICLTGSKTEEGGYTLTRKILSGRNRPDALITANDNMAVGAYRAIHEMGLRIPDDIAVASFNDISVAQFMNPPLTTVHLAAEETGETAVELLLERMEGRELAKRITLASKPIWRASTRHPAPITVSG